MDGSVIAGFVLAAAMWIGLAAMFRLVLRIHWGWALLLGPGAGLLVLGALILGDETFRDMRFYSSEKSSGVPNAVWFAVYTSVIPIAVALAGITRSRYLKSRGK